ncbi:MAG: hypothetical protein AAF694_25670 [Bacteroidota bacterium]
MAITLHLSQELEHRLREKADNEGVSVANYIVNTLESQVNMQASVLENDQSQELDLVQKINDQKANLSNEWWDEYQYLSNEDDRGTLSKKGRKRLIQLNDQKEQSHARLIELSMQLAKLRNTSLRSIMEEFGIQPV